MNSRRPVIVILYLISTFPRLLQALSSHIVRACNGEESPEGVVTAAVDRIVPLLLEKGLVAPSAEVCI